MAKFSRFARQAIVSAAFEAKLLGQREVTREHLFLGLVKEPETLASQALVALATTPSIIQAEIRSELGRATSEYAPVLSTKSKDAIELAIVEAQKSSHPLVQTHHLLLALVIQDEEEGSGFLVRRGINLLDMRKFVEDAEDHEE